MKEALQLALAVQTASLETRTIEGVPHVILPEGFKAESFEKLLPAPTRIKAGVSLADAKGFIDYWQKFGTDKAVIFASEAAKKIRAVFDYHEPGQPAWGDHTATLQLSHSDEWKAWLSANNTPFPQRKFAEFIEDHIKDVFTPTGAELLEVAKSLNVNKKLHFRSSQELSNGQVQLTYSEEIQGQAGASGQLTIPTSITIGLRVFKGQEAYKVTARFRYRVSDEGVLTFSYHLDDVEKILEDAFNTVLQQISTGCKGGAFFKE
jgi:uncharacterized protein YfdQ (DUF2303 family)